MLLPNETTVATPTAVSVYVWLWLQIIENIGISASLSAIKPDYQAFVVFTPNFAPKTVKVGCFYIFLTSWAGQKGNAVNISRHYSLPPLHAMSLIPFSSARSFSFAQSPYIGLGLTGHIYSPNQTKIDEYISEREILNYALVADSYLVSMPCRI